MRIVFRKDAVLDRASWSDLDRVVLKIEEGWHEWQVDDPEAIEGTDWIEGRDYIRELFEKASVAATYPRTVGPHLKWVVITLSPELGEFSPDKAALYASRPLKLLMENRFTDGMFLKAILNVLAPPEVVKLLQRAPDAVSFDGPGGSGELPKLIERYVAEATAEDLPVRMVVFTDSDGRFPGDISDVARKIDETCRNYEIPCRVLQKRAIENYIPQEVLEDWCQDPAQTVVRPRVAALRRLNTQQRDYFPMKKGFRNQTWNSQEAELFGSIDSTDHQELQRGFGDTIIEILESHRQALTAQTLRRRDGAGELDGLVEMIMNEL